jgi:hypothetical protein
MKKIALVGNSFVEKMPLPAKPYHVPALSSHDAMTGKLLGKACPLHDVVFWFTGHEFHGCRRFGDISRNMVLPPASRSIVFEDVGGPQGSTCKGYRHILTEGWQRHLMRVNFLAMTRHWMDTYVNLVIVPISNYRYENHLKPEDIRTYSLLMEEHRGRIIDLSPLDNDDETLWDEDQRHLSDKGRGILAELMLRHIGQPSR